MILQITDKESGYEKMLLWRGIVRKHGDNPCKSCSGSGVKPYPNTSTWMGGVGGCVITNGVCNVCWGSGIKEKPWTNLKELYAKLNKV